jgi:hypothetical protein
MVYIIKISKLLKICISLFLFLTVSPCYAANCTNKIYYHPGIKITVSGIIESVVFWGPPNFGGNPRTDQKYTGAVLRLDCPIYIPKELKPELYARNINESANKDNLITIENNKIILLNVRMEENDNKRIAYRLHNGWHAKITGTLRDAVLPSDHTPIVLDESSTEWLGHPNNSRLEFEVQHR